MEDAAEKCYHFPLEVLTKIFADVDLRTLVFGCRFVCRFWKDAVECPELWKIKIFRELGDKFETDSALSTAYENYPWYMCYALCNNVFNRNLFVHSEGLPQRWRRVSGTVGHIWSMPFNTFTSGFGATPQELSDEGDNECFFCIFGINCKNHTVDLYAHGLTRKIMRFQPPIYISEWFTARSDYTGIFHIEVKLYKSEGQYDPQRGYFTSLHRIRSEESHRVSHTFTNYGPDIRYVVFRHGVDTYLPPIRGTFNHIFPLAAASKIAGTKLIVSRPDPIRPSDSTSRSSSES